MFFKYNYKGEIKMKKTKLHLVEQLVECKDFKDFFDKKRPLTNKRPKKRI